MVRLLQNILYFIEHKHLSYFSKGDKVPSTWWGKWDYLIKIKKAKCTEKYISMSKRMKFLEMLPLAKFFIRSTYKQFLLKWPNFAKIFKKPFKFQISILIIRIHLDLGLVIGWIFFSETLSLFKKSEWKFSKLDFWS